ncbi:signal recognition particle-docking protein FtsY [Halovenus rubra]|uniref:Signal recognition particle receptor FtsY n=2 Tax=Halovenus rubra TaxID=869890 RepID=A0ABD5X355_9EURY|nr:signal recognition particle-docking protein FtsY [Halovenus rubra]
MFDGLKNKLSSFTEDAEDDVEAESAAETEGESNAEAEDEELGEDDAVESQTDATEQPPEQQEPDTTTEVTESDETEPEESDVKSEADSKDEQKESSDDDGGRGLGQRAKLLATGKTVIDESDLDSHLEELEFALLGSDVEMEVAQEILDGVKENLVGDTRRRLSSTGNMVQDALRESLYDVISVGQFNFNERVQSADKPVVIIFTGVNGVGKTTTIAKLSQYFEEQGLSSVLANGDTFRAGANEQLEQHADNLDKRIISHEQGSDPAAVIYDAVEYAKANDVDVVLGDTAGRLHTNEGLMDQLEKIDRVIDPDMTLFVDEAVAGQDAVNRAREFDDAASVDGSILTKADADQQGGAAISVAYVTGKPILFLGTGQDYDDIDRFEPDVIVDELLGEE